MYFNARTYTIIAAAAVFLGLPLLFYGLDNVPRRTLLKESISLAVLLSFSLILGQFFLARSNETVIKLLNRASIKKLHKLIAYAALSVIVLHPFLVVLPRYFEAGVKPLDAFVTMLTSWDSLGILLGLAAWTLMVALGLSAAFRMRLIKRSGISYGHWRYFHGGLAIAISVLGIWHAVELGRHSDPAMVTFLITVAAIGVALLIRLYWHSWLATQATNVQDLPGETS